MAAVLAIFLGSFGAHRFYLRSYGLGTLYLLFFWTLIPGLLGLIEGIRYLLMDKDTFTAKYTQESTSDSSVESNDLQQPSGSQDERRSADLTMEVSIGGIDGTVGSDVDEEQKHEQSTQAWVPPGEEVSINGYMIPDGMIYVGTELNSIGEFHGTDACLIDTTLGVDASGLDPNGTRMSYWPSYSDIDSGCRATYIKWLENGRRNPEIDIGYVFLFFYGIERRVLFDAQHSSTARSEIPQLLNEVEKLLEVYGDESSFSGYATRFLNAVRARYEPESLTSISHASQRREIPLGLRVKIGREIANKEAIDPELAYEWFQHTPDTSLRTPARRCDAEFKELFVTRYVERFDGGLTREPNKTPLTISYNPASRSIPQQQDVEIEELPDISPLSAPVRKLQELANDCCEELDTYSRYVGKTDDRDSLEALSLLPKLVLERRQTDAITELLQTIENELGGAEMAETKLDFILEQWPIESGEDVRKRDLRRIALLLEKLGYGIEPDVRFSAPSRGWGDPAVLYRSAPDEGVENSSVSEDVRLIQKLAANIVLANDEVALEQTEYLAENLGSFLELSELDQTRLDAHRRWLILDSPTLHGVRQRAEDLPDEQNLQIANFLTTLACSDGSIVTEEIQELSKIYSMLGLDEEMVHMHLHQLQTQPAAADDEPVTVQKPESTTDAYEIPDPKPAQESQTAEFELDQEQVNKTLEESQEVSKFLVEIFEEEDDMQSEPQYLERKQSEPDTDSDGTEAESLSKDHRRFLEALSQKQQWEREDVVEVAREQGLFPDAAMEVINDYAFELVEGPVIEGTDEIVVNQEVSSKILQ